MGPRAEGHPVTLPWGRLAPWGLNYPSFLPEARLQARLCPGTPAHRCVNMGATRQSPSAAESPGLQSQPLAVLLGGGRPCPDLAVSRPAGLLHGSYENLTG